MSAFTDSGRERLWGRKLARVSSSHAARLEDISWVSAMFSWMDRPAIKSYCSGDMNVSIKEDRMMWVRVTLRGGCDKLNMSKHPFFFLRLEIKFKVKIQH